MDFLIDYFSNMKSAMKSSLIIVGALVLIFLVLYFVLKKVDPLKKTPLALVPCLWLVDTINGFVKENIGKRWKSYSPWFLTLAIYILFSNISAVYLLTNPTSYVIVTFVLAMCSFFVIQASGIVSNGLLGYLKGYLDPNPVMLPMNIISELTLPISLCLRLFGNVISGACISILIKSIFSWWSIPFMPFINLLFDIALSIIQVVVFVLLSIIFTSMKIKDEEKIYTK